MGWTSRLGTVLVILGMGIGSVRAQSTNAPRTALPMPGGAQGIGFDDLRFSPKLNRVLVPAGRTGSIDLVNPDDLSVTAIGGFSTQGKFEGGHGEGTTSVDEGRGFLFASDRTSGELVVVDPAVGKAVGRAKLSSGPDYVRWIEATGEVWVTQPDQERIEIFRFEKGEPRRPIAAGFLPVPGGPESLIVDSAHGRAFTNSWKGTTMALDLASRRVVATWPNACVGSRGLALDPGQGFLFVGCAEGKAVVLQTSTGQPISTLSAGNGVDIIDFDPKLSHLYFPGGKSATMSILGVSREGKLSLLETLPTAAGGHCVVADLHGKAYVCDPAKGRLLVIRDTRPASR